MQRYGNESSASRRYKNTELYLLPPALFPSLVLDTMDQRYLDCNNLSIISLLLKPMRIELYNDKWLQPNANLLNTQSRHRDQPSNEIDSLPFTPHADIHIPTVAKLNVDPPPPPELYQSLDLSSPPFNPFSIYSKIINSCDKLFL